MCARAFTCVCVALTAQWARRGVVGINVLVATPGRLLDHVTHTAALQLRNVAWLVLDEADRLLDRGFAEPLQAVLAALRAQHAPTLPELPAARQTILCSATLDARVMALVADALVAPVRVSPHGQLRSEPAQDAAANYADQEGVEEDDKETEAAYVQPRQLRQAYVVVPVKLRLVAMLGYLHQQLRQRRPKGIVFLSTRDAVDFYHALLSLAPAPGSQPDVADGDGGDGGDGDGPAEVEPREPVVRAALAQLRAMNMAGAASGTPRQEGDDDDRDGRGTAPTTGTAAAAAAAAAAAGWDDLPAARTTVEERRQARRALRLPLRQGALLPCPLFKLHGQLPAATRTLVYRTFCAATEVHSP
jgi:hypothetical protein